MEFSYLTFTFSMGAPEARSPSFGCYCRLESFKSRLYIRLIRQGHGAPRYYPAISGPKSYHREHGPNQGPYFDACFKAPTKYTSVCFLDGNSVLPGLQASPRSWPRAMRRVRRPLCGSFCLASSRWVAGLHSVGPRPLLNSKVLKWRLQHQTSAIGRHDPVRPHGGLKPDSAFWGLLSSRSVPLPLPLEALLL